MPTRAPSYPEGPCLFVEATGQRGDGARRSRARAGDRRVGGRDWRSSHERDPDARARLWKARHDAAHATAAKLPGHEGAGDGRLRAVDRARRGRALRPRRDRPAGPERRHRRPCGRRQRPHRRPGRPTIPASWRRSEELVHNVVDDALARGGTCTGEHGIGLGKIGALEQEHGDLIPLMRAIKDELRPERHPQPRQGAARVSLAGLGLQRLHEVIERPLQALMGDFSRSNPVAIAACVEEADEQLE